ncbi:CDP-glycerol glycerophosphotransferase family protein [Vagococcus fluvialis]
MRLYYADNYDSKPINENMILYETRDGTSIVDSPLAMFLELASNEKYNKYNHVWIINKEIEGIETCIPSNLRHKVKFIHRGTIEYVDAMLTAKYLISNATFETFFTKRQGQIYINTWHGTPLKFMGFDIPGMVNHSQNVLRNFLMTDYIISPNSHTSNIFIHSYKLDGLYPGTILEGGYPRIDATINSDNKTVRDIVSTYGTRVSSKPIILFCPTWKGTSIHNTEDDIEQIVNETLELVHKFESKYQILLKVHPFVYKNICQDERIKSYLVSDLVNANDILAIVDVLVTDYSSIFFDFLVTKKPIIFYSWDRDLYQENRGMYLDESELPGPIVENLEELIESIKTIDQTYSSYESKHNALSKRMIPYEDGKVTSRYIERIFENKSNEKIKEYNVESDKIKLLIYPGGMVNNGITNSLLNLVNNIDYDKYDVTVISNSNRNREVNNNIKLFNKNVRPMFRFGMNILTAKEAKVDKIFNVQGLPKDNREEFPEAGYKREMNRLTANIDFDVAIDFSGYSYFWGRHILAANAKKYVAFMHNDLFADSEKVINGKQPRKSDLQSLFSIYYKFDKLLSVSPMTRDVNLEKLSDFVTSQQMSFVYNSINIDQILNSQVHASENNMKSEIEMSIKKRAKSVIESNEVAVYKNIEKIKENISKPLKLATTDTVVEYATCTIDEQQFSKISLNGKYIGWIDSKKFDSKPLVVEKIVSEHFYGTVSREYSLPIWKKLRTNTEADEVVAYARYFRKRYLEVTEVAYTEKGKYYLVNYKGEEIGWMHSRPLMRLHKVDPLGLIHRYFRRKMEKMDELEPVVYSRKVENNLNLFAKLKKESTASIWSVPEVVIGAVEFPVSEDYYETAFKISRIVTFSENQFCGLALDDGSFIGYINKEQLELIDEKDYANIIFEEYEEYGLSILPKVDLAMQKVPKFDASFMNFVNMGRLSPEKNQEQLIHAFKKFNDEVPKSRLYILGKGPLENEIINLVHELEMERKVILLGHIPNPFEFMKLADFFVLPSFYEGQPMVLLESLTIKMNILASNIPANINVVGENEEYGLLTEGTDIIDIYNGLNRAYNFDGTFKSFDYQEYNLKAINSFYKEIS